jgi:hypothetical protein
MTKIAILIAALVLARVAAAQIYDGEQQRRWNEQREEEDFRNEQRQRWYDEDRRREEETPVSPEIINPTPQPWLAPRPGQR